MSGKCHIKRFSPTVKPTITTDFNETVTKHHAFEYFESNNFVDCVYHGFNLDFYLYNSILS